MPTVVGHWQDSLEHEHILAAQPIYLSRYAAPGEKTVRFTRYMRPDVWSHVLNEARVFGPGFAVADNKLYYKGMSHSDCAPLLREVVKCYSTIPDGGYVNDEARLLWGHHAFLPDMPSNWGHFIWTYLMRLAFEKPALPLLVSDKAPDRFLDWARRLGFQEFITGCDGTVARRLHVNCTLARRYDDADQTAGVLSAAAYALRHRLGVGLPRNPRSKLYVSRKHASWRTVVNEGELIDALKPRGFEVITPEIMTVGEQLDIIGRAGQIVMPIGGASPITMFAPEDCKVVELGFERIVGVYASAIWADVLGQPYVRINGATGEKRGPLDIDYDYKIDVERVLEQL